MLFSVVEPIKVSNPVETTACMTARSGQQLAQFYGYTSVGHLCTDLPERANVLDMGAGASNLGHDVTSTRPDIEWTNFDARYGSDDYPDDEKAHIARMQATAPPNLTYVGGNILNLPDDIRAQRYHRIFSYYLFPHILDYSGKAEATRAMREMLGLLTPDGALSTGPNRYFDNAWTVRIAEYPRINSLANDMIRRYTESWEAYQKRMHAAKHASA